MFRKLRSLAIMTLLVTLAAIVPCAASDYINEDYLLVYETETVTLHDMPIFELNLEDGYYYRFYEGPISLEFYDSTVHKTAGIYKTHESTYTYNGKEVTGQVLSGVKLIRGHKYIVSSYETDLVMPNYVSKADDWNFWYYISLEKDGDYPTNIKELDEPRVEDFFAIMKRATPVSSTKDIKRVNCTIPVYLTEDGTTDTIESTIAGAEVRFISPLETINKVSNEKGEISVSLIEDCNYMVQLVDGTGTYCIQSFPLTVKDHSEEGLPKSIYNHFNCRSVEGLCVVEKSREHENDIVLTSLSGKTTVAGLRFFRENYYLNDRALDKSTVKGLGGYDYDVFAVEAINMYRIELSRLAAGDFVITHEIPEGKTAQDVCYVDDDGKLISLDFTQEGSKVTYKMDTLTMYPNVIVYGKKYGKDGTPAGEGAAFEVVDEAITSSRSDEGPAGTVFGKLQLRSTKQTKNTVTLKWNKVKGASKYVVYANACGKSNRYKKVKTLTKNTFKLTKAGGKKLRKGRYYKAIVVALDKSSNVVSTSKAVHVATKGGKAGNAVKITTAAKKGKVSLKKGKTFKLRAKQKAGKKTKIRSHRKIAYESSNTKIATVSGKGVIKGKAKGTCVIYIYAQNGKFTKVKVTVKG